MAILGVLAVHIGSAVKELPEILRQLLDRGQLGVQLFFVVSAFTLCQSADWSGGPTHFRAAGFFIRRIFRIAPAYWLAAVAYFVIAMFTKSPPPDAVSRLFASLLFLNYLQPGWVMSDFPPGGWSIVAEVFFYLSFPFLYAQIRTARHALLGLMLSVGASTLLSRLMLTLDHSTTGVFASVAVSATSYFGIVAQLPVFLCGFLAIRMNPHAFSWRGSSFLIAVVIVLSCLTKSIPTALALPYFGLLFAAFLKSLSNDPPALFVNAPLIRIGEISFSMYLVHFAIIDLIISLWPAPLSGLSNLVLLSSATIATTVLVSHATHRYIEKPFIALGRRLAGPTTVNS